MYFIRMKRWDIALFYQQLLGNSISYTKKLEKDLLPISNHMGPTDIVCLFFYYSSVYLEAFEIVFHLISFFVLSLLAN